ncbi:MAG: hypothetical protein ACI4MC_03890 [Candidatus Coproplasma sp.]
MRNASVAVLDIRSDEICAVIAEKGVNNTFIIKNKYCRPYDGYAEGEMLDQEDFVSALTAAAENLYLSAGGKIRCVYVGVPAEFVKLIQTDKVITYRSSQIIGAKHIEEIKNFSAPQAEKGYTICACDCLFYYLSDKRKVLNPIGAVSDSLRSRCCFYACKTGFIKAVKRALKSIETVKEFHWIPQNRAEAFYLVPEEKRGGYSVLLDFGYISSSFSVIYGNGIAFSESFSIGVGHIAALVMEALEVPYEVASQLIKKVNLNSRGLRSTIEEVLFEGKRYAFPSAQIKSVISEGLDAVCETIEACRQSFMGKDLSGIPIMVTGEGIGVIRGMNEHISSRLVTPIEVVAPSLPYYDKPVYSSLFSLLSAALN